MPVEDLFSAIGNTASHSNPAGRSDKKALKEQEVLENGRQQVQTEVHRLVRYSLRFGGALIAALICVRFWHLGAPESWRWLTDGDVQGIDKMLFSSAFGGAVISYLKEVITPRQNKS